MTDKKEDWWGFEGEEKAEKVSDFYKMKTGENKLRVLTQFERVNQLSVGEYPNAELKGMVDDYYVPKAGESVTTQGWAWAIVRETGEIKIFKASKGILKLLSTLRANDEYAFDDFPMPYDVTIHNTGEGPNRYSITAARKNSPVTEVELAELEKKTPIADIISKIKEKKGTVIVKEAIDYPQPEGEIPF
jgi:hypothetical protein